MLSVAHWFSFSNPPLTANKQQKSTTSLLDGAFLLLICPAPPQAAGGCASVSEQIPERGGLFKRLEKYSFSCTHFAIFAFRMKKLLTYILPVFLFAVISYGAEGTVSDVSLEDFRMIEESIMAQQFTVSDSTADSEFCLPRQISTANTLRAHNSVKRTSGAYRINTEFIASGKIINAGLRFCIQIKSIITRSSLADPAYRLLKLGKLII